ncbi:uncharacterized protein BDR25DRAFT_315400 [Lindgomyces ingoldianus]|uniref:Uncharacterized protein n=1 Tax=Lindgomyces ingoldianus TaxID=673940 RepID=A0ACB6QQV9_9PLEO|nr:uncharacterized protein BDR25DRAFT_315400 [Lindgomyces ingoldianus]KAF2469399.1 hypothetical protein BDR25DRAFT_315400 [Lindgomyces ingoldianus]
MPARMCSDALDSCWSVETDTPATQSLLRPSYARGDLNPLPVKRAGNLQTDRFSSVRAGRSSWSNINVGVGINQECCTVRTSCVRGPAGEGAGGATGYMDEGPANQRTGSTKQAPSRPCPIKPRVGSAAASWAAVGEDRPLASPAPSLAGECRVKNASNKSSLCVKLCWANRAETDRTCPCQPGLQQSACKRKAIRTRYCCWPILDSDVLQQARLRARFDDEMLGFRSVVSLVGTGGLHRIQRRWRRRYSNDVACGTRVITKHSKLRRVTQDMPTRFLYRVLELQEGVLTGRTGDKTGADLLTTRIDISPDWEAGGPWRSPETVGTTLWILIARRMASAFPTAGSIACDESGLQADGRR